MEQPIKVKYLVWIACIVCGLKILSFIGFVNWPESFDAEASSDRLYTKIMNIESVLTQEQRCNIEKLEYKQGWFTIPSRCK